MAINSVLGQMKRNWDHSPIEEHSPMSLKSSDLNSMRPKPTLYNLTFDHLAGGSTRSKAPGSSPIGSPGGYGASDGFLGGRGSSARLGSLGMAGMSPATIDSSPASYRHGDGQTLLEDASPYGRKMSQSPPSPATSRISFQDPTFPESQLDPFQAKIIMSRPLEGNKLGLAVKDLVVLAVNKPEAWAYGWRQGDRISSVNGRRVTTQDEFSYELGRAMNTYFSHMTPLTFDVNRKLGTGDGLDDPNQAFDKIEAPSPEGFQRRRSCCC